MAGRIRDEDVVLVKERADIAEVVGEVVTLRPAGGGNFKGLCPFHDEKSPSFSVRPSVGSFHCFGCQEGGDVISFMMKIDHLTFAETVERLADRYGIQLRYEEGGHTPGRQQGQRTRLVEAHQGGRRVLRRAAGRTRLRWPAGSSSTSAASTRTPPRTSGSASRRATGTCSRSTCAVAASPSRSWWPRGLAREGQRGPIDRFMARLLWPIRDIGGDVVGFGARRLFDDDRIEAKYVNTPETPIYKKSSVLYGVDLAKKEIARRMQAVVVEGYTDVMACHLAGVETAIATCGTAFGDDHIKILRRLLMDQNEFRGEVVFTFDGDSAGQKAALKAFQDDQKFVTQTFVAVEPSGMDPCELRQAKGDTAVRDLVARRVPLFEFAIQDRDRASTTSTPTEGRTAGTGRRGSPSWRRSATRAFDGAMPSVSTSWLGLMDERFILRRVDEVSRRQPAATRNARGEAPAAHRSAAGTGPARPGPAVRARRRSRSCCRRPDWPPASRSSTRWCSPRPPTPRCRRRGRGRRPGDRGRRGGRSGSPRWTARRPTTPYAVWCASWPSSRCRPTRPRSRGTRPRCWRGCEELAATRRIAEVKSRLQRINPVERWPSTTGSSASWSRWRRTAARCATEQSAPSDAGLATGAHDCVMTIIWTGLPDLEIDSVIGCARAPARGRLPCRGGCRRPAGPRD